MTIRDLIVSPEPCGILFDFTLPGGDPADGVFFDATLSISHARSAEVTNYPVEEGSDISDHRRKGPATVTITGLLANVPSGLFAQLEQFTQAPIWDSTRAREAFAKLLQVYESEEFCSLSTGIELYENGVLTDLAIDDKPENGDAILFSATWREIRVARSETVAIEEEAARPPKASPADAGTKATPPAPEADVSGLLQLGRGARGMLGL